MVKKITQEEIFEYIKESCEAQGLPFYVQNEAVMTAVAVILKSAGE